MEDKYIRSMAELEKYACMWWPKEIRDYADKLSILQTLLDTQEKFISILKLADREDSSSIFNIIQASSFSLKCFLKHLMILTDVGAEPLQRINAQFSELFPTGKMSYVINDKNHSYTFKSLPVKSKLNNEKMKVDTKENMLNDKCDEELTKDVIMLLLYGGACKSSKTRAVMYRCTISDYIGNDELIELHIRQNYIRVSRIIAGRTANDLAIASKTMQRIILSKFLEMHIILEPLVLYLVFPLTTVKPRRNLIS